MSFATSNFSCKIIILHFDSWAEHMQAYGGMCILYDRLIILIQSFYLVCTYFDL